MYRTMHIPRRHDNDKQQYQHNMAGKESKSPKRKETKRN